jgi:hypothetical protein
MQLMLQATVCDCLALDPFAFEEDGLRLSEVDVGWGKIAQALVIASTVVMRHEGRDLTFEIAGQVIALKQDAVLERLMPALDFALGLRVIGALRTCCISWRSSHSARSPATYDAPLSDNKRGR